MCEFKSAIVLRDESRKGGCEVFLSPWTEHHSELMHMRGVKERARINCACVEFSPPSMADADKPQRYRLKIEEERCPDWFDDEMKEFVSGRMRDYIKSIIITGDVFLLIGGQFILTGAAKAELAKNCMIYAVMGSATLGTVCDNATLGTIGDNATLGTVCGSVKLGTVCGSATLGTVDPTVTIGGKAK